MPLTKIFLSKEERTKAFSQKVKCVMIARRLQLLLGRSLSRDRSGVLDDRCAVTWRETGEDQSLFIVVFTENLVVTQVVAVTNAEPTTTAVRLSFDSHNVSSRSDILSQTRRSTAPATSTALRVTSVAFSNFTAH